MRRRKSLQAFSLVVFSLNLTRWTPTWQHLRSALTLLVDIGTKSCPHIVCLQERLADLEESLKSGDVFNEKILDLPKRKVHHLAHCGYAGMAGHIGKYSLLPATR